MSDVVLSEIGKRFGDAAAVADLSLTIPANSFLALLGPSGCGKTTVLRLIAGLERPDAGSISIGGRVMADAQIFIEPEDRGLGLVFQSYALWPHMTVSGNVEFGLRARGLPKTVRRARAREALELVGLESLAARKPHQLSGGQRQRVALARSLAARPPLILLDEPLANLDAHLREAMQVELRRIHAEAGTTFVFVTHDQREALALADHVAVMDAGRLQQFAPAELLYRRPATPMVAAFIGGGRILPVDVLAASPGGEVVLRLGPHALRAPGDAPPGPAWLCLRPDDLTWGDHTGTDGAFPARVVDRRFEGATFLVTLAPDGVAGTVEMRAKAPPPPGATIHVWPIGGWVFPREVLDRAA